MNVILNEVKNLLSDNTLSTLSMVGYEGIATSGKTLLAMTIILSTAVHDPSIMSHAPPLPKKYF
mgnify:CR=1 FL=1